MAIESWRFGNPEAVLEQRQNGSCLNCRSLEHDATPGFKKSYFKKGLTKSEKHAIDMKRCKKYQAVN